MANFAHIDPNTSKITQVIVIEPEVLLQANGWFINGVFCPIEEFIQTSYNTHHGVHLQGEIPLRKNFAGIGYTYDKQRDAFIRQKPEGNWILDEKTCDWKLQ